ncbi:MAG: hypothetical protein ACPLVD_05750 [Dictyoglomus turgidum]|uniref:hypothetical protein n=1 Tax=Dictyoglomus turgidum TaxID=513050 RepID=UPI003C746B40
MNNRFEAFLLDTVGWLEAFSRGFSNVMLFGVDQNTQEKIINMIFGTWSGYSWSYAIAESITLPTDQFTEIAVIWNKSSRE